MTVAMYTALAPAAHRLNRERTDRPYLCHVGESEISVRPYFRLTHYPIAARTAATGELLALFLSAVGAHGLNNFFDPSSVLGHLGVDCATVAARHKPFDASLVALAAQLVNPRTDCRKIIGSTAPGHVSST
jgi:hypothetical protein